MVCSLKNQGLGKTSCTTKGVDYHYLLLHTRGVKRSLTVVNLIHHVVVSDVSAVVGSTREVVVLCF
jgi:hypothetical protein